MVNKQEDNRLFTVYVNMIRRYPNYDDWVALPVFSDNAPDAYHEDKRVWSYDDRAMITGFSRDDLKIVDRETGRKLVWNKRGRLFYASSDAPQS